MLAAQSALEIAALVNRHEVSAAEVVAASLARAEHIDPSLRAFQEIWPEQARNSAKELDKRITRGERFSLAGVPIGVKAWGSTQSPQAQRLIAAGCIPIGATSVPQKHTLWQTWGYTDRGLTVNPWRPELSPGGSSAGSATAVAAGIVPLATGGDSAGSIRIPAAWCGVVGLKPTSGLLPGSDPKGLSTGGPLAHSVADIAGYIDAVASTELLPYINQGTRSTITAVWSATLGFANTDIELAIIAQQAALRLAARGVVRFSDTATVALVDPCEVWQMLRKPDARSATALAVRAENNQRLARLFKKVELLIIPTTPNRPHGHRGPGPVISTELTWAFNLSGHPAISVLAGFTDDGCPVGVQLVAQHGQEMLLLQVAAAWERLAPWSSSEFSKEISL